MNYLLVFFGIIALLFITGLVFFLRSLILKKNSGCGWLGILGMIPAILIFCIILYVSYSISHISDQDFIDRFFERGWLTFPPSGKIIEKNYGEGLNTTGDYHCAAIIEMDTLDYMTILREVQLHDEEFQKEYGRFQDTLKWRACESSFLLERRYPLQDCAYVSGCLWFHKNKRIIVYEIIDY